MSDIEGAKSGFVMPGDFDAHQFLQVHGLGHGGCLVHVGGVVDGSDVGIGTPVSLFVAFTEDLVANALDVGVCLQLDDAFAELDGWRALRCGCFCVVPHLENQREGVG